MSEKTFETTLAKLKTRGYWRIEFYPTSFSERVVSSLLTCKEIMRDTSVQFRGWDVPHIPHNRDDKQNIYVKDSNRCEAWIDWHLFKEVWRFYQSGKFTFLDGLNEHWYDEFDGWGANPLPELEPGTVVDVINVIYTLTELTYFFHNLAGKLPEIKEWSVRVTLNNVNGNRLATLDRTRTPLHGGYISHSANITAVDRTVTSTELKNTKKCLLIAKDAAQEVFQNFEWQAADVLIDGEQDKLINKRF